MTKLGRFKQALKVVRGRLREGYIKRFRSFGPEDFLAALRRAGVREGDVLNVHVSYDKFEGFRGSVMDVIRVLKDAVGPEGTIFMPTMPFTGSATDYVMSGEILDVKRTPSRMGLVTEMFRRMKDVRRSVHPTHAVAAWGRLADELVKDHEKAGTPCGHPSPYSKLADHGGKVLLLGTGARTITYFHYVEEVIESRMPFSPFTTETFTLRTKNAAGEIVTTVTRLYDRKWALRRYLVPLEEELRRKKQWRTAKVGGLVVTLMGAEEILRAQTDLAERGVFLYSPMDDAGRPPEPPPIP